MDEVGCRQDDDERLARFASISATLKANLAAPMWMPRSPPAAIVYRFRAHEINLFVTRSASTESRPVTLSKPRGFATVAWAEDGLAFVAVSDVDPPELTRFAELVRAPSS